MRDEKANAFRGMVQLGPGKWRLVLQRGPSCFEDWLPSWRMLKTSLIMLMLVTLGTLNAYERLITTWARRYGRKAWASLYQADCRMRKTRIARIRRRGASEALKAREEGHDHPFNRMPWDWAFRQAVSPAEQADWWKNEFVEPAGLLLSGAIKESDVVDGDEPIESSSRGPPVATLSPPRAARNPGRHVDEPPAKRARQSGVARSHRLDDSGLLTHNRQNKELCKGWQAGQCGPFNPRSIVCPVDTRNVHQCCKCLSPKHGGCDCNDKPLQPKTEDRAGGRGGGRGRRRGRGRGRS